MKKIISLLPLLLAISTTSAQVLARVDNGLQHSIGTTGGLYFANDTLRLVTSADSTIIYPIDAISVVTFQVVSQSIDPSDVSDMQVYPIPANRHITLQGIGSTPQQVSVYNTAGQLQLQQSASDGTTIDIQTLPAGIYILRCGTRVSKIVKQL